ncbi:glycerophosphodiester phosphodiesterase family protein [Runella sp.]|uniref:glycerophosphodiester phosphodiesterase family protein n=1 Tax=Runella sp. TaxID=1960881 RepID=UPI003D0B7421
MEPKKKRIITIVGFLLLIITISELLKELNILPATFFGNQWLDKLLLVFAALIYEIFKDYSKDIFKDLIKNNNSSTEVKIFNTNSADLTETLKKLKARIIKRSQYHIQDVQETEVKFIEKLNWRIRVNEKKYLLKQGDLFSIEKEFHSETPSPQGFIIIGFPGVGKTTSMHNYLLKSLDSSAQIKIPIYFSLSLWTTDQPLVEWMKNELDKNYQIKKGDIEELVNNNVFTPVFDGLDQVNIDLRSKCAERIYEYSKGNSIILTCRPNEFMVLDMHFRNNEISLTDSFTIFELNPLLFEQVSTTLSKIKDSQHLLDKAKANEQFAALIAFPMLLYIVVTIRDAIKDVDFNIDIKKAYQILWEKYDIYIFNKEGINSGIRTKLQRKISYREEQTRTWLHRLSCQTNNNIFIEDLQPEFLTFKADKYLYYFFSRIFCAVSLSIAVGFFLSGPFNYFSAGVLSGCTITIITIILREYLKNTNISTKLNKKTYFSVIFKIILFYVPCSLTLISYFGFSTPRKGQDMRIYETFALTEANAGLFMALFMGVIFGLREYWYDTRDVKPVERISIDWKQFIKFGMIGGILLGVFLAICAILVVNLLPNSTFSNWGRTVQMFSSNTVSISLLAITAGIAFGFPLIGVLGVLKQDEILENPQKKIEFEIKPNYGIRMSFLNLLKGSIPAGLIMVSIYGLFFWFLTKDFSCFLKGVNTGFGGAIMVALWFGGFDVIQHFVLRIIIYLRHYGPWDYVRFMEFSTRLRFVKPAGASYEFFHDTLYDYFKTNFEDKKVPKVDYSLISVLILIIIIPLSFTVYNRISLNHFWQDGNGFNFVSIPKDIHKTKVYNTFVVGKSGHLSIKAKGTINVGSFAGSVTPEGTEGGFLGFRIGDTFDFQPTKIAKHGALLVYSTKKDKFYTFADQPIFSFPFKERVMSLKVSQGDTIRFLINDNEWNNNSGKFQIKMQFVNPDKKRIIAHRGGSGLAPENTLEAIKNALSINAKTIEIDIRQTKDNVLVVMHDNNVGRTTNGNGKIGDYTYENLKKLDVGNNGFEQFSNIKIPTLKEVLLLLKPTSASLLIEVKDPSSYIGLEERLIKLIREFNMADRVEVFCFDSKFIKNFKMNNPDIKTGVFVLSLWDMNYDTGAESVGLYFLTALLFPDFVERLQRKNYNVYVWTVNSSFYFKPILNSAVDGIITDYPNKFLF